MSTGESSLPDNKGNDADMNEDHTLSNNTDISPQKIGEVSAQENHEVASEVDSVPVSSPADDEANDIGAVAPSSPPGAQSLSAMSTDVENGQRVGFVQDGVDNLHGLSIARTPETPIANDEHHESFENHQSDVSDSKAERVNPFNSSGMHTRQKIMHHEREMMPKFLSLDTFGQGEVPANFLEPDIGRLQLGENLEGSVDEITPNNLNASPKFEASVNTGTFRHLTPNHNGLDHDVIPPTVPPPPSDPWVKVYPESPSKAEEALPEISLKKEQSMTPEKEVNETPKPPGLCLDGELKKAPAIEPNASLSPMVLDIPGPCEPEDLIEGVIFSANYLGTTQLVSNRNPAKNARMFQAQEAVNRIKAPDGESQPTVEVDLFISTSKIKILNADTQETMMSHTLRSISYIADIGDLLVVMAKRLPSAEEETPEEGDVMRKDQPKRHRIICHVLSSSDSHLIAESIGQCFNVAYQQFLQSNCIEPQNLTQADFNQLLDTQEMYHDDLVHYSKQENVKEIWVEKKKGETMGIAIVESGWGSIIPTVILANLQHGSPIERNGKFSIGDQIMAINSTSMVGLPLQTCHSIIRGLRNQTLVKINIVSCPPVVSVLIKRPNLKHQLGFSVQNGIICSLMRGGIAERGGVRVGHRIIEINNQSVVATPHDKIVQMLVTSVGEIQMKTMPAAMYRLLTGQEQPIYL